MNQVWKSRYEKFMYLFVFASQVWLILQLVELYKTKQSEGLSIPAFAVLIFVNLVWIFYALVILEPRNNVILLNSSMSLVLSIIILVGILVY